MFGTVDDKTIHGFTAQLIGPCLESVLPHDSLLSYFHWPSIIQAHFGKRRQRGKRKFLQQECISLCTHIIDTQRHWQTNYSFSLNISSFCMLFANSQLFPSYIGKNKNRCGLISSFWKVQLSTYLLYFGLFYFFQVGFLTPLPSPLSYYILNPSHLPWTGGWSSEVMLSYLCSSLLTLECTERNSQYSQITYAFLKTMLTWSPLLT